MSWTVQVNRPVAVHPEHSFSMLLNYIFLNRKRNKSHDHLINLLITTLAVVQSHNFIWNTKLVQNQSQLHFSKTLAPPPQPSTFSGSPTYISCCSGAGHRGADAVLTIRLESSPCLKKEKNVIWACSIREQRLKGQDLTSGLMSNMKHPPIRIVARLSRVWTMKMVRRTAKIPPTRTWRHSSNWISDQLRTIRPLFGLCSKSIKLKFALIFSFNHRNWKLCFGLMSFTNNTVASLAVIQ